MTIEELQTKVSKLTAENEDLKHENSELQRARDKQIEINRSQGQKIRRLTEALEEANLRIKQLEDKLGDAGGGCNV